MKKIIFSIALYSLIGFVQVQSAELVDYFEVVDTKPFSTPFTQVPRIVFANPPHRVLKLTDESCAAIRKAAQTATHEQIRSSLLKQTASQSLSTKSLVEKHIETAESYGWMNAMNYVNDHLHDRTLDLAFVQEINRRLGRLTVEKEGAFRKEGQQWELCEFTCTERLFSLYIDRTQRYRHFFKALGASKERSKKFCESTFGILNDEDGFLSVIDHRYISTESIRELLDTMKRKFPPVIGEETGLPCEIDIHEAEAWELEEKETNDEYKAGYVDSTYWFDKRMYAFCDPKEIEHRFTESIRINTRSSLHPIEQAAHIWLDIIRLHPFQDANMRTAKAVASFILLKHGYLPPLLTKDDVKECRKMLRANLDPRRGYHYFTQYIAGLVQRAQDQYAGQTV